MSINSFLKEILTGDSIRDYSHGSEAFVSNTFEYQPRYKHLFHVVFNFTPDAIPYVSQYLNSNDQGDLHIFVKDVDLPQFAIDIEDRNQYNRHRYTQHRINYQPVNISFHDDHSMIIRDLWYAYYSYYYQDPEYQNKRNPTLEREYTHDDIYDRRDAISWGMDRGPQTVGSGKQFFRDIRVYSMFQKRYAEYTLVNPIITNFGHDKHSYAEGDFMQHNMSLQYETVTYSTGLTDTDSPANFAVDHYDQSPSPISPLGGGTTSVLGRGGLLDAGLDVLGNPSLGSIFGLGRTVYNSRDGDIKRILTDELKQAGREILRGKNPLTRTVFPKLSSTVKQASASGNSLPPNRVSRQGSITSGNKNVQKQSVQPTPNQQVNVGRSKVKLIQNANRNMSDNEGLLI